MWDRHVSWCTVQNNINVNAQPTVRKVETPEAAGKAPISSVAGQPGESFVAHQRLKACAYTAGCSLRTMASILVSLVKQLQAGMGAVRITAITHAMHRHMSTLMQEGFAGLFRRHGNAWCGACLADSGRHRRLRQVWVPPGPDLTRVFPKARRRLPRGFWEP